MGSLRFLTLADAEQWQAIAEAMPQHNLEHLPRYSAVFETYGDGLAECAIYEDSCGRVLYPYLRRPIDAALCAEAGVEPGFDITTPYGYGGYVSDAPEERRPALIAAFRAAFSRRMQDEGGVCEFIRFHPNLQNQRHSEGLLTWFNLHTPNVVIDLQSSDDDILRHCRSTHRRYIRRARDTGLTLQIFSDDESMTRFMDLYGQTMRKHHQTGYLNFRRDLFVALRDHLPRDMILAGVNYGGAIIASAIFLVYDGYIDYFLGGSDEKFLYLRPNHFLHFEVAMLARSRGFRLMHLGGGSEKLQFFKQGFSQERRDYFVAKNLFNQDAYARLTRAADQRNGRTRSSALDGFFPSYRAG